MNDKIFYRRNYFNFTDPLTCSPMLSVSLEFAFLPVVDWVCVVHLFILFLTSSAILSVCLESTLPLSMMSSVLLTFLACSELGH